MRRISIFAQFLLLLFFQNVFAQEVVLPDGITEIKRFEFENKNISEINIPNSVVTIGESAFAGNNLKKILLPDSIVIISPMTFAWNKLEKVIFPKNIGIIDNYSFYHNQIDSIVLPKSLVIIGSGAFGRNKLTSIILPEYLYQIGEDAFANNQLKEVIIPASVRYIGDWAFNRNELSNVELPSNIDLGKGAFQRNQLTAIVIPEGIYEIPDWAFFNNKLSSVSFSESVRTIGKSAFEDNELYSVILPKSVEKIEEEAFKNNPLTEITVGKNVSISEKAMGLYSDKFIEAYEMNKRKAGIYTYDKSKKEWLYQSTKSESLLFQLFAGKYSAPFYGAFGFLIGLIFFLLSKKNQKSKPIYSNSDEYVYAMKGEKDDQLQIFWDNEIVENVRSVELTFWNDGKKSIRQNDIPDSSPITIKCKNKHVKILSYSLLKSRETISLESQKVENEIQIVLSNNEAFEKNDGFKIIITYTSEYSAEDDWIVDARIIDAHKINNVRNVSVLRRLGETFVYILLMVGLGILPVAIYAIANYFWDFNGNFYWVIMTIILIIWYISWGVLYFFTRGKKKYKKPKWN